MSKESKQPEHIGVDPAVGKDRTVRQKVCTKCGKLWSPRHFYYCKGEQPEAGDDWHKNPTRPCPYNVGVQCVQRAGEEVHDWVCPQCENRTQAAEKLAKGFHEAYERLAPEYNYKTRKASAVEWKDVPQANKSLMVAVAGEILDTMFVPIIDRQAEQLAAAKKENAVLRRIPKEEVWYWQGDGHDFPESLTCPVIMSAEKLRAFLEQLVAAEKKIAQLKEELAGRHNVRDRGL